MAELEGPAFYALRGRGWRDLVNVLHPPYTAWHLANVGLGAAAASEIHADRLIATLAAFFLAVGISAHALDELNGHPLKTQLSDRTLIGMAAVALGGAIGIGVAACFIVSATLAPFVLAGGFIVVAYNLELFGGRFHTDFWLAASWGAFPALTSWWVNTLSFESADVAAAGILGGRRPVDRPGRAQAVTKGRSAQLTPTPRGPRAARRRRRSPSASARRRR